jgi:CheY-like chemotaxis protein
VLVVEDNLDAAESLRMLLEMAGHEVEVAYDGLEALQRVDAFGPHVAFVDLGLPELDGFQVARRIRRAHPSQPLLVALSGYGREEDKREARAAGFDHHLVKPVDFGAVVAYLGTVLAPQWSLLEH